MKGGLVTLMVLMSMQFVFTFDDPRKKDDVVVLNGLLTQRDRERSKMFHHVTYQSVVEQEPRLKNK